MALPDREPLPTFRTVFASPPEQELTDEQFMKSMQTSDSTSIHNQRRSAMKARMNIAAEAAGISLTSGQLVEEESASPSPVTFAAQQQPFNNATRPVLSKMMDSTWRCTNCGCSPFMTTIIRAGPMGDRTLCNACGLYQFKFNSARPPNYIDGEIKNDIPHLNDWQNYMSRYKA